MVLGCPTANERLRRLPASRTVGVGSNGVFRRGSMKISPFLVSTPGISSKNDILEVLVRFAVAERCGKILLREIMGLIREGSRSHGPSHSPPYLVCLSKTTYHVGQLDHVQPPYLSSLLSAVFSSPTSPFPFPPFFPLSMVPSLGMTCSSSQRKGTGGPT